MFVCKKVKAIKERRNVVNENGNLKSRVGNLDFGSAKVDSNFSPIKINRFFKKSTSRNQKIKLYKNN